MSTSESGLVHRETMELAGTPDQIRRFIMTPDRILDYFPGAIEGQVLEAGKAILCHGGAATSILEVDEAASTPDCLVVLVTSAMGLEAPFSREQVEAAAAFTMIEDWKLTPNGTGTTLEKSWRDVRLMRELPIDMVEAVREGAKHETAALIDGWDRAAKS